ncbi:MAG: 1-acyl-sn-glycerol-3-phosphate acyltransferase [Acidimicrobiia bacterium]|nr:1-acyl-sn-glycerol-3-phosphate acyltransferase [Acidimicrobiia bacterium]
MDRSDRAIRKIVAWATSLLYHRVEVRERPDLTAEGPILANASHFGGFSDPLLLIHAMDRVPRFIGRDVIWKNPIARAVVTWVGAIPVHKPEDGAGSSNDQMFASTYRALADGELVTIFPEGITVDDPAIAAIKTGSARIALGARASGVQGLRIVSAGIHYSNKAALRSDVFVDIGWEIDLDRSIDSFVDPGEEASAENRHAVRRLTDEMERRLREAAPDFEDWRTARALSNAAAIALRDDDEGDPPGHADRERLARLIDDAPDGPRAAVVAAVETYEDDLDAVGLDDDMWVSGLTSARSFTWHLVRTLVIGLLLLPFAIVGAVVNAVPFALVWLIGRLRVSDAMMATVKPLGALAVFLLTWIGWVVWAFLNGGLGAGLAVGLLMPVYLFAVIAWFERVVLLKRGFEGLFRSRRGAGLYEQIATHRRAVVEAVADAL